MMSSTEANNVPIPTAVDGCARNFLSLAESLQKPSRFADQVAAESILDEFDRFKLWAGNIAAHRKGRRSLEYRLRDAAQIKAEIHDLLSSLSKVLNNAITIVEGERLPWDEETYSDSDSDSDSSSDGSIHNLQGNTELKQLYASTKSVITSLMRLSMAIREPAPNRQARSIDKSHFEQHDVLHVQAKFPAAPQYLAERLGRAISSRRQYLTYREVHHNKLSKGIDKLGLEAARTEFTANSTEATRLQRTDSLNMIYDGDDTSSMTSYATSVNATLRVPNLPREAREKEHYNCPLCYALVAIHTTAAWKRHLYQDLHPYCCTFEDCTTADRLYDSRHAWFSHELEAHYSTFQCIEGCYRAFQTEAEFKVHVKSEHEDLAALDIFYALKRASVKSSGLVGMVTCRLCDKRMTFHAMQKHLGHHQEQLALFALPANLDDTEDDHDEEEQDSLSNVEDGKEEEDGEMTDTSDVSEPEEVGKDSHQSRDYGTDTRDERSNVLERIEQRTDQSTDTLNQHIDVVPTASDSIPRLDELYPSQRINALRDYQMQFMPLEQQNKQESELRQAQNQLSQHDHDSGDNIVESDSWDKYEDDNDASAESSQNRTKEHELVARIQAQQQQFLERNRFLQEEALQAAEGARMFETLSTPTADGSDMTVSDGDREIADQGTRITHEDEPERALGSGQGNVNYMNEAVERSISEDGKTTRDEAQVVEVQGRKHLAEARAIVEEGSVERDVKTQTKVANIKADLRSKPPTRGHLNDLSKTEWYPRPPDSDVPERKSVNDDPELELYQPQDFGSRDDHQLGHRKSQFPNPQGHYTRDLHRTKSQGNMVTPNVTIYNATGMDNESSPSRSRKFPEDWGSKGDVEELRPQATRERLSQTQDASLPEQSSSSPGHTDEEKLGLSWAELRLRETELKTEERRKDEAQEAININPKPEEEIAPIVTQVFVSPPPSRTRKKSKFQKHRPTQSDWGLVREMDPNRPDITHAVSQGALNSGSETELSNEEMQESPNDRMTTATGKGIAAPAINVRKRLELDHTKDNQEREDEEGRIRRAEERLRMEWNLRWEREELMRELREGAAARTSPKPTWENPVEQGRGKTMTKKQLDELLLSIESKQNKLNEEEKQEYEDFARKEANKEAAEKAKRDEEERELEKNMRERLAKFGFEEHQIDSMFQAETADKGKSAEPTPQNPLRITRQPTYVKVHKDHLDIETLHYYNIPYEHDADPNYIIVLREMSQRETDILFEHTRRLRSNHGGRLFSEADGGSSSSNMDYARKRKSSRKGDREPSRRPSW